MEILPGVRNYQAQDGVNNGPIANHQRGRRSTGTNRMFVWSETVSYPQYEPREEG